MNRKNSLSEEALLKDNATEDLELHEDVENHIAEEMNSEEFEYAF
jgi:hypothetical protein